MAQYGFSNILLVSVIVVSTSLAIYYLRETEFPVGLSSAPLPAATFTPLLNLAASSSSAHPSDTSTWREYKNKVFGFSLKYPPSYTVVTNDPGGKQYPRFVDTSSPLRYEPHGLTIDYDPIHEIDAKYFKNYSKTFSMKEFDDRGTIDIYFNDSLGRNLYMTCTAYDSEQTVDICNQIVSSLMFDDS